MGKLNRSDPFLRDFIFASKGTKREAPEAGLERFAVLIDAQTGRERILSEQAFMIPLRAVERQIHNLPPVVSLEALFNRVKAGFRLDPVVDLNPLSLDENLAVLDYLYDGIVVDCREPFLLPAPEEPS